MIDTILKYFRSQPPPPPQGTVSEQAVKLYRFANGDVIYWQMRGEGRQQRREYLVEWRDKILAPVFNQETARLFAVVLDRGLARQERVTILDRHGDIITAQVFEPECAPSGYELDEADHVIGSKLIDIGRYHVYVDRWKDLHGLK